MIFNAWDKTPLERRDDMIFNGWDKTPLNGEGT